MNRTALVVFGSRTAEDKYGITSGMRVAEALKRRGWGVTTLHAANGRAVLRRLLEEPPDVVVPVGFGAPCEDGQICAVARLAGIPCSGPTPSAGGLMQDKSALSRIVDGLFPPAMGIRSPRGHAFTNARPAEALASYIRELNPPLVVKPAFSGSSEGLLVVTSHDAALDAATKLVVAEGKVLIQELEQPVLAEISCTVLDTADGPLQLPIVELKRDDVLVLGPEEKFGARALNRHIVPAVLTSDVRARLRDAVRTLHNEVGSIGLTRTDALVRPDGEIVLLEMNGIPGLLECSIACDAARAAGISFEELAIQYAESAFIRRPEPQIWDSMPE